MHTNAIKVTSAEFESPRLAEAMFLVSPFHQRYEGISREAPYPHSLGSHSPRLPTLTPSCVLSCQSQ